MNINKDSLVLPFNGAHNIGENYSQAAQDIFVLSCLDGKRQGMFLDLGSSYPKQINNTFLLENKFNWNGISIDLHKEAIEQYRDYRQTIALCEDCTQLDFKMIQNLIGSNIDYLSLDLEPADTTYKCLQTIPFDEMEFKVITFEHDWYRFGDYFKYASREIFEKNGYKRICSDVANEGNIYEDWYYNPKYIDYERIKVLECSGKNWQQILFK